MSGLAAAAPAPPGAAKGFRRGTHRTVAPEVTLERLRPLLPAMGITRVGMLTGLDRIGLPVAMAVRPNGRSVAVSQGKGLGVAAAKVSAIMEAAETFHAESVTGPLRRGRAAEIEGAVDPARLPLAGSGPPVEEVVAARCLWIGGRDLVGGDERCVPFELVHADYTVSVQQPVLFQATTSGLAAGNVVVEAQLHALYEAIERDAIACWREAGGPRGGPGGGPCRPIDPDTVDDPDIAGLLQRIAAAEVDVAVWDVTSDIGVPVVVTLLMPRAGERDGVEPELGSGCHLDPVVALSRALTEAAQTRLTRISGARDDFEPRSYGDEARRRRRVEAASWLRLGERRRVSWPTVTEGFVHAPSSGLDADLETVLRALAEAGFDAAVWVDVSRGDLGIPVGRIVVPGLEGPWLPGLYRPGARARAVRR